MSSPKKVENLEEIENLEIVIKRHEKVIEEIEIEKMNNIFKEMFVI